MSAEYPDAVYSPRAKANKSGVVYTPAKTTTGYVEDITKLDAEVVAIQTALGTEDEWNFDTIWEWLQNLAITVIAHKTSHQNEGTDEISVAGLSGELADNQPPKGHHASHEWDGSDPLDDDYLNDNVNQQINGLSNKSALVTADAFLIEDNGASYAKKCTYWGDIKDALKTYFDGVYNQLARVMTKLNDATSEIDVTKYDQYELVGMSADTTFTISGTPRTAQKLMIRLEDNGTARALTWNAIFRASTDLPLPTTTTATKTMYLDFIYNYRDSKFDLILLLDNI